MVQKLFPIFKYSKEVDVVLSNVSSGKGTTAFCIFACRLYSQIYWSLIRRSNPKLFRYWSWISIDIQLLLNAFSIESLLEYLMCSTDSSLQLVVYIGTKSTFLTNKKFRRPKQKTSWKRKAVFIYQIWNSMSPLYLFDNFEEK